MNGPSARVSNADKRKKVPIRLRSAKREHQ